MAWSEQEVIAALAHSEMAVRDRAHETLGNAYPNCTAAMPAVIRAVEQYDWDDAFSSLYFSQFLPQSPATLAWAWKHLRAGVAAPPSEEPWYCYDLACIIAYADPRVRDPQAEAKYLPNLREGLKGVLSRPLELQQLSDDELWTRFEADSKRWEGAPHDVSRIELVQLAIALGTRGESLAPRLLECLKAGTPHEEEPVTNTPRRIAAIALGIARYKPAIDALFDNLHSDDVVQLMTVAEMALAKIGGDEVVAAMRKRVQNAEFLGDLGGRLFGVIPTEEALLAGIETMKLFYVEVEKNPSGDEESAEIADLAADMADGLLFHFDARVVEPAAALARLLKAQGRRDTMLESAVGITAQLLDVDLPERKEWYYFASEEARENRARSEGGGGTEGVNVLAPDSNVIYEGFDPDNLPQTPSVSVSPIQVPRRRRRLVAMRPTPDPESRKDHRLLPIRRPDTPIGRNDPCPCGSGKKYKNCCFRKD